MPPVFTFTKVEKTSPTLYAPFAGEINKFAWANADKGPANPRKIIPAKNTEFYICLMYVWKRLAYLFAILLYLLYHYLDFLDKNGFRGPWRLEVK